MIIRTRGEVREGTLIELGGVLERHGAEQHVAACYGVLDGTLLSLAKSQGTIRAVEFLYNTADLWSKSIGPGVAHMLDEALARPPEIAKTRRSRFEIWSTRNLALMACLSCAFGAGVTAVLWVAFLLGGDR